MLAGMPAVAQTTPPRPNITRPPSPNPVGQQGKATPAVTGQPANGTAGAQPGAQPAGPGGTLTPAPDAPVPAAPASDSEMVYLPAFAEPVQLSSLVELVARTLQVNMAVQGDVPGTVVFNAPIPIKRSDLIPLLDRLLEQQNYTITRDEFGIYTVHPISNVVVQMGEDQSTTRIIRTPNVRPSSLQQAIAAQFTAVAGGAPTKYSYIDDLGVIIATDTPRRLTSLERFVERVVEETNKTQYIRLELRFLAASVARSRALELVGATQQRAGADTNVQPQPGQPQQPAAARAGSLDNLSERLIVDPQGNALIFRGQPQEIARVQQVLDMIDVPNNLAPRNYTVGTWAGSIANIARSRGLGEITTINEGTNDPNQQFSGVQNFQRPGGAGGLQNQSYTGGPVMVVDESRGSIIYYATEPQHNQMDALIKEIDPQSERVIIGVYKLKNSDAEEVAAVIDGIINNTQPYGTSDLLPNGGQPFSRSSRSSRNPPTNTTPINPRQLNPQGGGEGDLTLDGGGYVVADKANNQILVKAPAGQQPEYRKLIERLDLRRAQVYIEAKIVAVTWTDDMRLAFETQLINANGTGGVLNTNFGLSSFAAGAGILTPKTVATGLGGLTAAVIKSDQVPIIMNALQTKTDSRILSSPQLLVDDNEEAKIVSVDSQPTSSTTQTSGNPSQTSFGGYEDAGTTLAVTPHISDGGYLGLKYEIELSNFTGSSTNVGGTTLPPPKTKNNLQSNSVTIPADTTVIVGGLNFKNDSLTRAQIPLLGDIPLIGLLFQDRTSKYRTTTLYVFLTPRILRDPTFQDLRILTRGPQYEVLKSSELPKLRSVPIDVNSPGLPPRMPASYNQAPAALPLGEPQPAPIPLEDGASPAMLQDERVRETKGRRDDSPTSPTAPASPSDSNTPSEIDEH